MFNDSPGQTPMFVHLITICIGLIIAFGLQQIVALFQRRRLQKRREAEQAAQQTSEPPPPPSGPGT
ncbi:MAG: hypothetical protein V4555_11660 [Acidobacteriota bacterium]